jgi:hypothetical protein
MMDLSPEELEKLKKEASEIVDNAARESKKLIKQLENNRDFNYKSPERQFVDRFKQRISDPYVGYDAIVIGAENDLKDLGLND